MKKLLILLLLLPILSFGQNCVPTLEAKDTCIYGYAKTFVEWESLDSGCVVQNYHQGTPYNTWSWSWYDQLDTNYEFYNNYSQGDPFASSDGFWFFLEMQDGSFTDTIFANDFACISGCMNPNYDNYNPLANIPANCYAIPPPQDDCLDTTKTSITIEFTPDQYAGETSLDIINQDDSVLYNVERPFFGSIGTGNLYEKTICVSIEDTVRFIIRDSYGDGICGSCFGGVDGNVLVTDECGDTIYSLMPGDNLNFGHSDTSDAFAMKDCSWIPVVGCPDQGYLEFNPAADIMNSALCVTPRVVGCMDTTMFDFNVLANVPLMEDSCNYTLQLTDGGGDGWLGAYVVVNQLGNIFGPYTNTNSFVENIYLNLKSNHPVTIRAYSQTSSDATLDQIGFKLINPEGVTIMSGGTNPWSDKIQIFPDNYITVPNCPTICDPYVYGCMDALAYNYNDTANTTDGSCYYSPGCTDPQFLEYYTQGFTADYNNGDCQTQAVWGCIDTASFNYDQLANLDNGGCVPVIMGCMQPLAFNYNAQANTPDTCVAVVYGCMSDIAINYNPLANTDDGSCIGVVYGCTDSTMWNYSPSANADDDSCIPYFYGCTDATMWNYDPLANTDNGSCLEYIYGCMDTSAYNYDPLANTDNGTCLPVVLGCTNPIALNYCDTCNTDDFSCILPIYGCTDSTMFNYNPLANVDNSSCIPFILGCTDPSMLNYDALANTEDFSCIAYIYGCMDPTALNYDPLANTDNESCITIVEGCMDQSAYNYNVSANVHDSISCLYDAGCISGAGNPYWLNDACYAWVISVDDYCCNNEWDEICQLTYDYCDSTYTGPIPTRQSLDDYLVVYPNPTKDKINISKNVDINVLNYIGDMVISKQNTNTLDMSKLSSGVYMLQITYKNKIINKQIIKK